MGADFTSLNNILEIIKDFVGDSLIDTLQVIPFLFLTYLILELMEHKMSESAIKKFEKAGPLGPIIGSALGIIPQCGFSSAASTFYAGRVITLGTLFAVYLSTSDEMIPIFIAGGISIEIMIIIIAIKFVIGIIIGFTIDGIIRASKFKNKTNNGFEIHKLCERDQCSCHPHEKDGKYKILRPAILHTLQVSIFVFLITLILNIIILFTGGFDGLVEIVENNKYLSVVASSLVGLIPNCAASIAIAQFYVDGILGFGALLAGLLDATGIGLIVLFRNNRPMKQNLIITVSIFAISVVIGIIATLIIG